MAFSGQITRSGAGRWPALTCAANFSVAWAWLCVTWVAASCWDRFLARGTFPWIAATRAVGAPPTGLAGSNPPASTSPAVTTAAATGPRESRHDTRPASSASAARPSMAPARAIRKVSSGAPPTATQRTSGATDWLMASRPQGKAYGHRSRTPSTRTHQPATAAGQYGSRSSSRWPTDRAAKMTASAPASAAQAYQASLISQDNSGTNRDRPNASPQQNDPRRLRPASATTSSPGPSTASGQASAGGNEANSARPPATESSSAQRVLNPPKSPARPVRAPASGTASADITLAA